MTLERGFLVASVAAIVVIFTAELLHRRAAPAKLPAPMLFMLRIALGVLFLFLGVIGSLLPVLQGWIFFLLAALVLFPQSRFAVWALARIEPRMPRMVAWLRARGIGTHRENAR